MQTLNVSCYTLSYTSNEYSSSSKQTIEINTSFHMCPFNRDPSKAFQGNQYPPKNAESTPLCILNSSNIRI